MFWSGAGLSLTLRGVLGDCFVVFDRTPFPLSRMRHAVRIRSVSPSQRAAARPAIGLDENRFFRCFVECRRRFVYLSLSPSISAPIRLGSALNRSKPTFVIYISPSLTADQSS